MKMMSMKRQMKKDVTGDMPIENAVEYPYGLRINLEKEDIDNIGMKEMPEIGKPMMLHAMVNVIDLHESEEHKTVGMQITDMALEEMGKTPDEKVFYGEDKG